MPDRKGYSNDGVVFFTILQQVDSSYDEHRYYKKTVSFLAVLCQREILLSPARPLSSRLSPTAAHPHLQVRWRSSSERWISHAIPLSHMSEERFKVGHHVFQLRLNAFIATYVEKQKLSASAFLRFVELRLQYGWRSSMTDAEWREAGLMV